MAKYELTTIGKKKAAGGLCVILGSDRVNLAGKDLKVKVEASKSTPEHEVLFKGATQDNLKAFFDLGNQKLVLKVETKAEQKEAEKKA